MDLAAGVCPAHLGADLAWHLVVDGVQALGPVQQPAGNTWLVDVFVYAQGGGGSFGDSHTASGTIPCCGEG